MRPQQADFGPGGNLGAARAFPPDPAAVPAARRYVDDVLSDWRLAELSPLATLLVSELATNAVVHAGTGFELRLRPAGPDGVRVELEDASPDLPIRRPSGGLAAHGRGLLIVDALAARSGTATHHPGKVVWFELEAERPGI